MAHVDMQTQHIFLFVLAVAEQSEYASREGDVFCSEQGCRCLVHNAGLGGMGNICPALGAPVHPH